MTLMMHLSLEGRVGKVNKGDARGLDYLHTGTGVKSRVIHHDIKSSNVLLDEKLAAKISHFGVSRIGPANQLAHRLIRKSDVYAFGVVLLETLCGRPALNFTLDEQQHSLAGWAKRCIKEGKLHMNVSSLVQDRPTMTNVLSQLEFVLQSDNDQKRNGRTTFIEKARLLLSTKAP
nr:serine/threonine/dual specificity protein kinase, catalytic domain-containing protein [Tanacetum cinerariifolium]